MAYTKRSCVWCGVWYSSRLFAWWCSCFWSGGEGWVVEYVVWQQTVTRHCRPVTPRPAFCGIAFRAREVERYLLDVDPNGGVDPSGCFPMFFRKTASVLAPKLSCLFRRLLRGGEFPLEWRIADVTLIPKRSLIVACLQLSADFDYTSSVEGFWKVDRFAVWSFFGEIWGPAFSPVFIQEEIGYLWRSYWQRLCWSVEIRQGWRACTRPYWFQCGMG